MKYFSKITLGLILCAGFVSSCKDDDEVGIDGITIDKEEITIGAEGGTEKIADSDQLPCPQCYLPYYHWLTVFCYPH